MCHLYNKKMSLRCLMLLVICVVFITAEAVSGEGVKNVFVEVGGRVSFRPASINPPVNSIIWKHRNSIGPVVKAIEWDEDGFNTPNQIFKGITTVDKETGEITITDLNFEHSGLYTIDVNSKEQEQRFNLKVLAALPKPEIKIEKIEINPNAVYLMCEYSETIIWKNSAGETLKGSPHSPKGELLKVEKQGNPDVFYTCTLKNAVRESTSDPVYERDLFEGEGVKNVFVEVGGRVSFRPASINPPVNSIIWKHRNSIGPVVKAIEWDEDGFNTPNQIFKGITTLDKNTGEIAITDLNIEHSGLYTIDVNSKEQEQRFNLKVLAPVPKPEIKIEKIEINPNAVYLMCEYSEMIFWKNSAGETLKGSPHSPKGELLKVENQGNPEVFYTCTLKNAVRESTSDPVYERDLFEDYCAVCYGRHKTSRK